MRLQKLKRPPEERQRQWVALLRLQPRQELAAQPLTEDEPLGLQCLLVELQVR